MLRGLRSAAGALLLAALGLCLPGASHIAAADVEVVKDKYSGDVTSGGSDSGSEGGGSGAEGSNSSASEKSTVCRNSSGREVECETGNGIWSSGYGCYLKLADPAPPLGDAVWGGREDGAIYWCTNPDAVGVASTVLVWVESTPELPPPDPEVLARRAIATIGLRAIDLGVAPEPLESYPSSLGAVGVPVWLWSDSTSANTTGPASATASERGFTVSVSGRMTHIEWDLGDGSSPITCGLGQRFDVRTMTVKTPVSCGRQTGYQKQGIYTITATSYWEIDWSGIGESGTIYLDFSNSGTVRIGEIQVVING